MGAVALGLGLIAAAALGLGLIAAAAAEPRLPLPRFVSLRAGEVNVRTGPGRRYPIRWVFRRRHMPVEIIAEFENWRQIRDWEGEIGWVHRGTLSGRRTVLVVGRTRTLRRDPGADAPALARAEAGVIGRLLECRPKWCKVEIGGYKGWLRRGAQWGVTPGEARE